MEIEFLSNRKDKVEEVADMIYKGFVAETTSKMTYEEFVKFFSTTKDDALPVILIALDDDVCLGTVSIFENDLRVRPNYKPWLASLFVKPEYRSKFVGKKLTNKVIDVVRDLGFQILYLRTEDDGEYYKRLGWEYVETVSDEHFEELHFFKVDC